MDMETSARRHMAITYARSFIGTRYYWPAWDQEGDSAKNKPMAGNDDPLFGFDCSGFASEVCRAVGWIGGRERLSSQMFLERFPEVQKAKPGDLLIFGRKTTGGERQAYHVSLVLDEFHQIEAGGGGRGTDTDIEAAYKNAFVRVRPLSWRESERIAIVRPW